MTTEGQQTQSERIYEGRVISLRIDTLTGGDGETFRREVVEHPGAVAVVPLDDNGSVVMVTQYRHPVGEWLLEIPAGTVEEGEDPDWCAARELEEETGFTAQTMRRLFSMYMAPGYCTELLHVYVAEGLVAGAPSPNEDERIEVSTVPLDDVQEMIREGRIRDAKTIAALMTLAR
ncbi:MAG: NUDIX hydrolase [Armatimonadetes bacterium]|nr:NUDIX hydrolase [Armatimonadota bacterium]